MGIRKHVKQLLKMCGHAFVSTVHERLDVLEREVQRLAAMEAEMAQLCEGINSTQAVQERKFSLAESQMAQQASAAEHRLISLAETQTALLEAAIHNTGVLCELTKSPAVETNGGEFHDPETSLMEFLYSYLPARNAIDIGAHTGEISQCLLRSGYEVYAFEPNPPVYAKLVEQLGDRKHFHPFPFAIGSQEGEMPLHLAEDLSPSQRYRDATLFSSLSAHQLPDDIAFTRTIVVPVKDLANLHRARVIPEDIGLVKIDTEGFDLEVIRGMGDHCYPVVIAEFWDEQTPLAGSGLLYTLDRLVAEMRERGYFWHTVFHQAWMGSQRGYYSNHRLAVPNSWGNVFFFRDHSIFAHAQAWCSAVLPRTYFQPATAS